MASKSARMRSLFSSNPASGTPRAVSAALSSLSNEMRDRATLIHTEKWQSVDISSNPQAAMVELTNVTFSVPQQYFGSLVQYRAQGALKIQVTPPGPETQPEEGELTFMDNTVDVSTGTLKLKGTFPNPKQRLWPGQFATVTLTLAAPEVITVASSALQTSQAGQHVFVIKEDKTAELRPITVERLAGPLAVISKGLTEGETVVTDGQLRVIPGRPVEVKTPGAPGGKSGKVPKAGGDKAKGKTPDAAAPATAPTK
jgi:multidrug efflux system membrane fusion protein